MSLGTVIERIEPIQSNGQTFYRFFSKEKMVIEAGGQHMVYAADGPKKVEDVKIGDTILNFDITR